MEYVDTSFIDFDKKPTNFIDILDSFGLYILHSKYIKDENDIIALSKIFYTRFDPNNNMWDNFEYRGLDRDENGNILKTSSNKTYIFLFNKSSEDIKKVQIDLLVNDSRCKLKYGSAKSYYLLRRLDVDYQHKEIKPRNRYISKGKNSLPDLFEKNWSFKKFINFYNDCERKIIRSSLGSDKIIKYLSKNDIPFLVEKSFPECKDKNMLPFDFVVPNFYGYTVVIEVDGEHHRQIVKYFTSDGMTPQQSFEKVKEHDKIKNKFCESKGFKLIRLHYENKNFKDIEKQLKRFLDDIRIG